MVTRTIATRSEFAGILREQTSYAEEDTNSVGQQINQRFDRLLLQSGLELAPPMILALSLCSAVTFGGLLFVIQENLLTTALAASLGAIVPVLATSVLRLRRQTKILGQMPGMVEELARAAKTGRSLESCLQLVADDTPSPLGNELRRCTKRLDLGMTIDVAFADLPGRTGLSSSNVLVTALSVHRDTGGDLVKVLERLSQTIRDRIQFRGRLQSATAASRATALLMVVIPPAVLIFFTFRNPDYFTGLMGSTWGRTSTIAAILLQFVGTVWVLRILKSSGRI